MNTIINAYTAYAGTASHGRELAAPSHDQGGLMVLRPPPRVALFW